MKKVIKESIPYIVILAIVILIRSFFVTPVRVVGDSMVPNFHDGEILILSKISYRLSDINRFDVVVVKRENDEIIKRVIGLPGEHVSYKSNKLYINDKEVKENFTSFDTDDFNLEETCNCTVIPEGKYLVLGDNRPISQDSRRIGLIDDDEIEGKVVFRIWPIANFGNIND